MRHIILILLLLMASVPICGQRLEEGRRVKDWRKIKEGVVSIDGRTDYMIVSASQVRRDENTIRFWLQVLFPNGSWFMQPGTDFGEIRFHVTATCTKVGTARGDAAIVYGRQGEFLTSFELDAHSGNELPRSVGQAIYEYLCERGTPTEKGPPKLKTKVQ